MLTHAVGNELVCACLLDVVIQPRQVELVHAEAHQIKKRLDVVDGGCVGMCFVFAQGCKHGIAFEVLYLSVSFPDARLQDLLGQGKVNQIIVAIRYADIV